LFFDPKASIDEKRFGMSKPDTLDNQSSLCDDDGPIPEFPALAVDSSSGRILPISEEQRAARREAAIRALRAISEITDETDTDDRWEEIYRNIDDSRPHRKLFEEMY
jgi:hypothetical protein